MFDTENILGQLVLGHLKKLAQSGMIPVPQRRPGPPQAPIVRAGANPARSAHRQRMFEKREQAYNQWAANKATFDSNKTDLRNRQVAGVKNRQTAAKANAKTEVPPVNTGDATFSQAGQGSSNLVNRKDPAYRERLTAQYAAQGAQAPAWAMNTNADTAAANMGVKDSVQLDKAVTQNFNPPTNGGGGSGMTPGSRASGVGTAGTSSPAGMTTSTTMDTGTPSIASAGTPPQMPSSGPSVSQGSTSLGPTSSPQVNSETRIVS